MLMYIPKFFHSYMGRSLLHIEKLSTQHRVEKKLTFTTAHCSILKCFSAHFQWLLHLKWLTCMKWLRPNSTHIVYVWHALLLWHIFLHTYIYIHTHAYMPHQLVFVTPDSVSLCSLANQHSCSTQSGFSRVREEETASALAS